MRPSGQRSSRSDVYLDDGDPLPCECGAPFEWHNECGDDDGTAGTGYAPNRCERYEAVQDAGCEPEIESDPEYEDF